MLLRSSKSATLELVKLPASMTIPDFPRINNAIKWTLEYYTLERIEPHMRKFAGTLYTYSTPDLWDGWIETTLGLHQVMEREINQTINYSNEFMNVYMFDNLKDWLGDYRISKVNESLILEQIDEYNTKRYVEFTENVEKEVQKFQANPNYQREHLEKYEEKIYPLWTIGALHSHYAETVIRTNYKYYVIENKPELLDAQYIGKYCEIVDKIITSFRNTIQKYVDMYESKRLTFWNNLSPDLQKSIEEKQPKLLLEAQPEKRLTVTLSVPQLAYLFKMLYEVDPGMFVPDITKTDLIKWIISGLTTEYKKGEPISFFALENLIVKDGTDKVVAEYWVKRLERMLKAAKKV